MVEEESFDLRLIALIDYLRTAKSATRKFLCLFLKNSKSDLEIVYVLPEIDKKVRIGYEN